MSEINALIAQGSKFGNAFGNFADNYEESSRYASQQAEQDRVRNAFTMAGEAAKVGDYKGASNWLLQARQPGPAVDLLQSSDPKLARSKLGGLGMQPYYWSTPGPDGKPTLHAGQLDPAGGPPREIPGTPAPPMSYQDFDTYKQGLSTRPGGQSGPPIATNPGPAQQAKITGDLAGKAQISLPTVETNVKNALDTIQRLRDNKEGRKLAVGMINGRLPAIGGKQADWIKDFESLQGATFLDAYESLRGAQGITDPEGEKGTIARSSLNRLGEDKAFDAGLDRITQLFTSGLENVRKKAAMAGPAAPTAGDPLADAKAAIAAGADRNAVIQRLQENHIDSSGL